VRRTSWREEGQRRAEGFRVLEKEERMKDQNATSGGAPSRKGTHGGDEEG